MKPWENDSEAANGRAVKENFADWFGESVVRDGRGDPLIVYHGTYERFSEFQKAEISSPNEGGFFFTPLREVAEDFGDIVIAAYLSIQNPMVLTEKQWAEGEGGTPEEMRAKGHDGIRVIDYDMSGGEDTIYSTVADMWIAFEPTQIKSVKNCGLFLKESTSLDDAQASLFLTTARAAQAEVSKERARVAP